jgi:hypothetical protein
MMSCIKPLLMSTLAVALFTFVFEFLVHGMWLMPLYEQTASLWRPMEEMGPSALSFARLFLLSFLISALTCKCMKKNSACGDGNAAGKTTCSNQQALCFGVILGLFMGIMMAGSYLWMPIPGELAMKWFIGGLVQGTVSVLIATWLLRRKGCNPA